MRRRREPREARCNRSTTGLGTVARWGVALGTSLVLIATVPAADGSALVQSSGVSSTFTSAPTAAPAPAGDRGIAPMVHQVAVPTVRPADRAATAQATGSRKALTKASATSSRATDLPLVAHVRSRVTGGFSMLGVTWRHTGNGADAPSHAPTVAVRSREDGTWSGWTQLDVDHDGPAGREDSDARDGTEPAFVGDASAVEVDVYSPTGTPPADLSVSAIDPGTAPADNGLSKGVGTQTTTTATRVERDPYPKMPNVVTRRQWGADERLGDPCWAPRYGRTFKAVFVHHTAGSNTYTRRESPGIVRGIYAYHTQSRHWCDIGYNFLVDKYGKVYEGRAGGIRQPVRGAHAGDYNVNSTGISLMGEFTNVSPTRAMKRSLISLVAWRLGVAYHGGLGRARINGKLFKRISGHRDAMSTACPGQRVYNWLPVLRRKVNDRLDDFNSRIKRFWHENGSGPSGVGQVRIGEVIAQGGRHTTFTKTRAYFKDGRLRTIDNGPFQRAYLSFGEVNGRLGYPVSRVRSVGRGRWADFEDAAMFWSPHTGARVIVPGPILRKYRRVHGPGGRLGYPETGVRPTADGSYTRFRHGVIRFDDDTNHTTVRYE